MFLFSGCGTSSPIETEEITLKSLTLGITTGSATLGGGFAPPKKGTAVYSDSSSKSVTLVWDKAVNTTTVGTTTYTASYTESGTTVKATFKLNVVSSEDTGYSFPVLRNGLFSVTITLTLPFGISITFTSLTATAFLGGITLGIISKPVCQLSKFQYPCLSM